MTNALAKLDKATQMLAEAKTLNEVKHVIDLSAAAVAYAKAAKLGKEATRHAVVTRYYGLRRFYQMWEPADKNKGSNSQLKGRNVSGGLKINPPENNTLTLKKLGLDKNDAYEMRILGRMTEPEFLEFLEDEISVRDGHKAKTRVSRAKEYLKRADNFDDKSIEIHCGEFQEYSRRMEDSSVDLILTDPPYPKEYLGLWQDMFDVAERILKPGKFLVCYANHQNLDEIFRLKNKLKYYWIFKIDFTAKPLAMGRNLIATWKPILIYQKMPFKKIDETIEDSIRFDYTERDLHEKNWGQTVQPFEYLIEKFSAPNDLIFEPFAGTGTTLIAARNKKRRCIGVELDSQYIDLIKGRLCEV